MKALRRPLVLAVTAGFSIALALMDMKGGAAIVGICFVLYLFFGEE